MSIDILLVWFEFAVCALLIGIAGASLSRNADIIAGKTGLSRGWVGLALLATVTSLPELVTGISSVTVANVPNIAVGDVLGSCVFNLLILVVLDFMLREESAYRRASQGHLLSAGFGVLLIGFTGLNILLADRTSAFAIAHIGPYTPIILLLYLVAVRAIFVYERTQLKEFAEQVGDQYPDIPLRTAITRYFSAGAVVIGAGAALPFVGTSLAVAMGWENSFVGTLFVAGVTSLPELAVSISALRIGALDMAIANLLGSNLFNIAVLAIDDLLYMKGPILSHISPAHAMSAMSAVTMTGVIIIGLVYRPKTRLFMGVGWISLSLFTFYLLNSYIIYLHGD